jgi:hypothetical protein
MSATTVEPEAPTDGLPVFVANGTRRFRAVRVGKVALGIALAGWVAALCASLIGFAPLPLPVLSGSDDGQAVSAVGPQSPGPRHFERGTQRAPSDGGSGVKSSAAARRGGGTGGGGAARSITDTSDTPARTQSPTAGVAQTASTTGSSSNQATSPQPTSISPAPSADPPPPAPSPSPTPTTPPPTDSTSPPDQPDPTGSPDGSGGTTSGTSSESTTTTPTPDTSDSGSVPG